MGDILEDRAMDAVVTNNKDGDFVVSCNNNGDSLGMKFLSFIGANEFHSPEIWKAALAELVGTTFLMFALFASVIAGFDSNVDEPSLLVALAIFVNAFLFLMAMAPLSGGHMNPTFTFIAALKGVVTISRGTIYMLAQFLGTMVGFLLIKSVMSKDMIDMYLLAGCSLHTRGATSLGGMNPGAAFILEFISTFLVLLIGITVAFDQKKSKELGLPMVCALLGGSLALPIYLPMTITGKAGYGGAGLNPARCLAPALLHGGPLWDGHWVFWLGPFFACLVYYVFSLNLPKGGLVWVDGEFDILRLTEACSGGASNPSCTQEKKQEC